MALVVTLVFFRGAITKLIPGIQRLKYKDIEVEFRRQVEEAREEIGQPPAPTRSIPAAGGQLRITSGRDSNYFQNLAEISPRAAILEAWLGFETEATARVLHLIGPQARPVPMHTILTVLEENELITAADVDALTRLRALRNQVVHGPEPEISPSLVADYASLLREITMKVADG